MSFSLNEIEALSKRAARGAGMSWGMSEETARAVRWLTSHDLASVEMLADLLTRNDRVPHHETAPMSLDGVWHASSGTLCPLASGSALSDCADRLVAGETIEMANVSHPLLVVPFAAWAAVHAGTPVTVFGLQGPVATDGYTLWIGDADRQTDITAPVSLSFQCAAPPDIPASRPGLRGNADTLAWDRLNAFASRTYAPATEESRLLGAGAGLSDND